MDKKYLNFWIIILFITTSSYNFGQTLDDNLSLLKPFTNKVWESEIQGLRGEGSMLSQREWKVIWEGKAIKYTSITEKLNVFTEGYFFWDPDKKEIGIFTLNSKGRFLQGHIIQEDDKILMYGYITLSEKKLEFKNYYEFTDDGKLLDTWYRFEDGEWKPGHSVELYEKKE